MMPEQAVLDATDNFVPAKLPRAVPDVHRDREAAKHFAAMVEHLGRAFAALEAGRWDSARDHLFLVRESSAICDASLNSGQPDPKDFLAQVRAQVPQEWAEAIQAALEKEGK
ncbi:hypothetical protein OG884_18440 [Streptosporangium sp. NBC_01755]|uniref:hypothetical protein n=1 Tax=Streptosporangium sp. NBC_01755 TaxID=2975949 RepID=UPI002DDBBD0B|nr:hypothetical protein [Streptosporangium sp. NBC_01755]WSD01498.1 hypothetical protein OG884_06095 [Streptosporangium sp. NBC_01755]WSD03786.1 hypothetical protein OG884_18440 [Streptosporangium sp. NBC_01755]